VLLLLAAGYAFLQTRSPAPNLAAVMPGGALLYLETPDFGHLLRDWDASKVKADWLESANYEVFSRSNLFAKLSDVYKEYSEAAGFVADLQGIGEIAGTDSALALYEIRNVEFLYISRISDAEMMKTRLWAVRDKFSQRQAGGVSFYLRTDEQSKRTVAFALTKGYLLLATRDDLLAQSLELLAGGGNPSIASDRWYRESIAAAQSPGELRLVMNLDSLLKSIHFRSYWVQRNASMLRRYWAGAADLKRSNANFTESRVFLRLPEEAPASEAATVSNLLALVPPEAGVYKASQIDHPADTAALAVEKLIGPQTSRLRDARYAPMAIATESSVGSESDLEARIDEQPLSRDSGIADSIAAMRLLLENGHARSSLFVQSSASATGTFVQTPSVIVLESGADWDRDAVRASLAATAGKLWTTSQIGAGWINGSAGQHPIEVLDGLGKLMFAVQGRLLFLGNDSRLLATVLDRTGTAPAATALTYAAGFRHSRERSNYTRIMSALDFTGFARTDGAPTFFSRNMESLSAVLSRLAELRVTEENRGTTTVQSVVYQLTP
jgi:hypothetical protein